MNTLCSKTKLIISFSLLVSIVTFGLFLFQPDVSAIESTCNSNDNDVIYELGRLEKEYLSGYNNKCFAVKGNEITIYKDELDYYTNRALKLSGNNYEVVRDKELNYLIRKEVLYNQAVKKGFVANKNEVSNYINEQKVLIMQADNREDFNLYLDALDMTSDEYWSYQFEKIRIDLSIDNYLDNEKKKLAKQNNLKYYDNSTYILSLSDSNEEYLEYEKLNKLWEEEYENLVNELIDKENIVVY